MKEADCQLKYLKYGKRMRVLLVEDSERLLKTIPLALRKSGFAVDTASDGDEGLWAAENQSFDLIILDIMLPGRSGLEILEKLRIAGNNTPVLLLTARDSVEDRVYGLENGADDYLTKPFALEELIARAKVLSRRRYDQRGKCIEIAGLVIDTSGRTARHGDRQLDLKPREFAILEYLALRKGTVISRTEIEEHVYDGQVSPMSNVVDSAICLIRRELARSGCWPLIRTRRGEGYILEEGST